MTTINVVLVTGVKKLIEFMKLVKQFSETIV